MNTVQLEYKRRKDKMNDEMFMRLANNVSEFSSCARVQVGAVLVVDNRPLISGYNGTPKGHKHCIDIYKAKYEEYKKQADHDPDMAQSFEDFMNLPEIREEHGKFSRLHEVHAEINIVAQAAFKGLATKGATLYVTHSPCNDCCKSILTAGIKEVVFLNLYDRETEGLEILAESDVTIRQLTLDKTGFVTENVLYSKEA
jgi:dCMP deaminase